MLVKGDVAGAFPMFFNQRRASDGKGFYARVNDTPAPLEIERGSGTKSRYSTSKTTSMVPFSGNNAEDSFTL